MSRPLRIEFPGGLYHITSRGNEQKSIFLNPRDRLVFLDLLDDVVRKYHVICHAYCLMDNHYHLLIETPEANVSKSMRQLNGGIHTAVQSVSQQARPSVSGQIHRPHRGSRRLPYFSSEIHSGQSHQNQDCQQARELALVQLQRDGRLGPETGVPCY
jgi:REP element-mobilizing transposase RayT